MKDQFEEGLQKAEASQHLPNAPDLPTSNGNRSLWRPWDRADALIKSEGVHLPKDSSVRLFTHRPPTLAHEPMMPRRFSPKPRRL
jgi:hypothetical protein